ncbi:hypothetical protein Bpfe_016613, partial [Biomphalaria pfeifferi]
SIKITRKPQKEEIIVRDNVGNIDLSVYATGDPCCNRSCVWLLNGTEIKKLDLDSSI